MSGPAAGPEAAAGLPPDVAAALVRLGLATPGGPLIVRPLTGGVSSDIWYVASTTGEWCLKRALPRLKVAREWTAPVARSRNEYDWCLAAGRIVPSAVPELAGYDEPAGVFAMRYYPPASWPLWKAELAAGRADPANASAVGGAIGRIHAGTAGDPVVAARFATDAIFHAIRLEPYLLATAEAHPALAAPLRALAERTANTRLALVHGDVSPKNILVGPTGPMLLDAECAWYGDPAFDVAFCLNHMLLKSVWVPAAADGFLAGFEALAEAYFTHVAWEAPGDLEARVARLLPGLLLARVDGKSPVEYITSEVDRNRVRAAAVPLLTAPVATLADVRRIWIDTLGR
jgi:aminoglycoside phosphotransferase (APT) family kinase protein